MAKLYSWAPDRKASRDCVRHFIRQALEAREWAKARPPKWTSSASIASQRMAYDYRTKSIHELARNALEYARLRAFMGGAYAGQPGDRPAFELWQALNSERPALVFHYSYAARSHVVTPSRAGWYCPPLATFDNWADWCRFRQLATPEQLKESAQ